MIRRRGGSSPASADAPDGTPVVAGVVEGSGAAQVLAVGDRLIAINGSSTPFNDRDAVVRMLLAAGSGLELTVQAPMSPEERMAAGQAAAQATRRGLLPRGWGGGNRGGATRQRPSYDA